MRLNYIVTWQEKQNKNKKMYLLTLQTRVANKDYFHVFNIKQTCPWYPRAQHHVLNCPAFSWKAQTCLVYNAVIKKLTLTFENLEPINLACCLKNGLSNKTIYFDLIINSNANQLNLICTFSRSKDTKYVWLNFRQVWIKGCRCLECFHESLALEYFTFTIA